MWHFAALPRCSASENHCGIWGAEAMALKRHRLIQRRRAVGLTQEALAERLGVDRSSIVRWEGGRGAPQPWQRPRLAQELSVTQDELHELLTASTAEAPNEESQRRDFVLRHPDRTDLAAAAELRREFDELAARYDHVPSASLLAQAGQQVSELLIVADGARPGRVQRELRTLQADANTLMGQLVWDASQRRDHATARLYYDEGVSVARHLRDRSLEAHALLRTSYVALYGVRDARSGLELALQAAHVSESSSHALAGLALLHAGEGHAMLGEADDCERALAQAESHLGRAHGADAAAELMSPTQFGRLAGSCYLSLGQYKRAQRLLQETASELRDRRKSRAIVLGNLTLVYIRQHELDAAVATLGEAITELEETRGGGGLNLVFSAARELQPWRQEAGVADVYDRLLALMAAT